MDESLKGLSPEELSYLAATLAVVMAKDLDDASICILGDLLFSIKVNLDLIAKQRIFWSDFYKLPPPPDKEIKCFRFGAIYSVFPKFTLAK
jgi:hypothetical protein